MQNLDQFGQARDLERSVNVEPVSFFLAIPLTHRTGLQNAGSATAHFRYGVHRFGSRGRHDGKLHFAQGISVVLRSCDQTRVHQPAMPVIELPDAFRPR